MRAKLVSGYTMRFWMHRPSAVITDTAVKYHSYHLGQGQVQCQVGPTVCVSENYRYTVNEKLKLLWKIQSVFVFDPVWKYYYRLNYFWLIPCECCGNVGIILSEWGGGCWRQWGTRMCGPQDPLFTSFLLSTSSIRLKTFIMGCKNWKITFYGVYLHASVPYMTCDIKLLHISKIM